MDEPGLRILEHLKQVDAERRWRAQTSALASTVAALKAYQQARFARSHADLLVHSRFGRAAHFFLEELYGPQDFSERDAQFARIVPALLRVFPRDVVRTVEALSELHALTEGLDSAMALHLEGAAPSRATYIRAWQATGERDARMRQISLVVGIGTALDRHTRSRMLRASLKAMRAPARAAGLGALQSFLEVGFEAFVTMNGADDFLAAIETREKALAERLFAPGAAEAASEALRPGDLLAQLP